MVNLFLREDGCFWRGTKKIIINGQEVEIDYEIAEYIKELNEKGYLTVASCAGHICLEEDGISIIDLYVAFNLGWKLYYPFKFTKGNVSVYIRLKVDNILLDIQKLIRRLDEIRQKALDYLLQNVFV